MAHRSDRTRDRPQGQAAQPSRASQGGSQKAERIARALARSGVASRREAERMIEDGRVAVNGKVLTSPAFNITPGDILTVDGKVVADAEPARLWRHHKPIGLLTTHNDPKGRATVFERLPTGMPRVISVGRLDLNSEGLLLLTNDGDLARALELPSSGWIRVYRARVYGRTSPAALDALKDGAVVEGVAYGPVNALFEREPKDPKISSNFWLRVSIAEGKNREVRRVLQSIGLAVSRLIRVAYGPFELGDLAPGAVAEVAPAAIRKTLGSVLPPERTPKDGGRLFNAGPDEAEAPRVRAGESRKLGAPRAQEPRSRIAEGRKVSPSRARFQDRAEARELGVKEHGRPRPDARAKSPAPKADGATPGGRKAEPRAIEPRRPKPPRDQSAAPKTEYKAGWAKPKIKPKAGPKKGGSTPRPKSGGKANGSPRGGPGRPRG